MKTLQKIELGFCLFFSLLLFSTKSSGQIKAVIAVNSSTLTCYTQQAQFRDSSTGNPTSRVWNFGDNTTSSLASPNHQFPKAGKYTVKLKVTGATGVIDSALTTITVLGPTLQYFKTIDTTCSSINVKFSSKASGGNPLYFDYIFGDGSKKYTTISSFAVNHAYKPATTNPASITVRDTAGCAVTAYDTLVFGAVTTTLASAGANRQTANRECTDRHGWTNYYHDNNTATDKDDILLFSIQKNGNNIGTIGDGTFEVTLASTAKAGSNEGIILNSPLISNPTGYFAMNRYWNVKPTTQPTSPVGVRFYFNSQDLNDINGISPHGSDLENLMLYKVKGNPDPSTNLEGASDIISIKNSADVADETHWIYTYTGANSHSAEFKASSFSGGGAGVTGDNEVLPVKLVSFNGKTENSVVKLNWTVASELNVERFDVLASTDGKNFTVVGKVQAKGGTSSTDNYTFNDVKINGETAKFYKLVIVDKDRKQNYSEVLRISLAGITNAISLYPVPANNYVKISSKTIINKTCLIEVYNSLGLKVMQVVKTAPGNTFELNTSTLPTGRYRMIIFNNNEKVGDGNFLIFR